MESGPYLQTVTGRRVNPFALAAEDVEIADIAKALANQCRFGGHCRAFYSVAQHSSLAADLVRATADAAEALWALLHDAAEAYLGDLPHPIKYRSELGALYRAAEKELQRVICARFALPAEPPASLATIDRALLAAERRALMSDSWAWPELEGVTPLEIAIEAWPPDRAEREFLWRFDELTQGGGLARAVPPAPAARLQ